MPAPTATPRAPRRRPTPLTGVLIVIGGILGVIGMSTGGFAGLLLMAGLVGAVTALYTVATGRRSWARLGSRKAAAIALAACLVTMVISVPFVGTARAAQSDAAPAPPRQSATPAPASTATPTPTAASVAFTEEAPADPAAVTKPDSRPEVAVADSSVTDGTALAVLATLAVKGKAPKTGYDRTDDFGTAWLDVDRNGCDTRNDILARDLHDIVRSGRCTVLTGSFSEPYTGKAVHFVRGNDTSALVQIDHIVALANAWQTGAQKLSEAQRISLANDPLNLLAADGRANAQKSDGDAATWLPAAKSFRCAYVARQVSVKATYGLWIAPAEHDAMARVLASCPNQPALTSAFVPAVSAPAPAKPAPAKPAPVKPAPAPAQEPVPAPAPAPAQEPAPAPAAKTVHPGSFCAPAGATGVTTKGTAMVCGTTANSPDRARWHKQ